MKQFFPAIFCLLLIVALVGCSADTAASADLDTASTEADTQSTLAEGDDSTTDADDTDTDDTDTTPAELTIAYSTKGFNPYITTDTLVEQTSSLLFENFVDIAPDFTLEYRLAEEIVSSGYTVTITLRSAYFADGTRVTTEDALQSLLAAMESDTYSARFANVVDATATDTQLILTLETPDSLFAYLLDIPILQADDVAGTTPTASGRYTYGSDGTTLTKNLFATFATDGPDTINLVSVSSYDEMISALTLGDINYTVQGEGSTSESSISSSEHYYKTNTTLFLGVNSYSENPLCNTAEGRTLLSDLIDRDELAIDVYDARAYAARGALNPFYPAATDTQTILSSADDSALASTMTALGYTYNHESGYYQNEDGENASVSILIHTGNTYKTLMASELSAQWAKYGIETTIVTASDFNSFLTLLESGEFELYIGEMKLYNNIELSSFWAGSASYGVEVSESLLTAYGVFRMDDSNAAAFEEAFAAEMPYIPLLWKNGVILTSRSASGVSASVSNPFYSFGELTFPD